MKALSFLLVFAALVSVTFVHASNPTPGRYGLLQTPVHIVKSGPLAGTVLWHVDNVRPGYLMVYEGIGQVAFRRGDVTKLELERGAVVVVENPNIKDLQTGDVLRGFIDPGEGLKETMWVRRLDGTPVQLVRDFSAIKQASYNAPALFQRDGCGPIIWHRYCNASCYAGCTYTAYAYRGCQACTCYPPDECGGAACCIDWWET